MGRLLLLSCSEAKVRGPRALAAIERYDGPPFRVVRRFLREAPEHLQDLVIYILSAKYGLIPADAEIDDYDERMTPARAAELREQTLDQLQEAVSKHNPTHLLLSLGRDYSAAVEGHEDRLPTDIQVSVSRESAGKKLTVLKAWLWSQGDGKGLVPQRREGNIRQPELPLTDPRMVQIRGKTISVSKEQALEQAREALLTQRGDPERYRTWYALVDGRKVNTKWWVSQLCGLPVSAFAADEARRVLRGLGIEVFRTGD